VFASLLIIPSAARSGSPRRRHGLDARPVADALRRIDRSVDPCGETATLRALLKSLERCGYEIRTSSTAHRNLFHGRTITWNPGLRSELEPACEDGPGMPVVRDPTASLLHELVHALDGCDGRNPGEHEFEAVRIENIYRRAAGLCQRTRYGDAALPASMRRRCAPGGCTCAVPDAPARPATPSAPRAGFEAADSAPMPAGTDAEPTR